MKDDAPTKAETRQTGFEQYKADLLRREQAFVAEAKAREHRLLLPAPR